MLSPLFTRLSSSSTVDSAMEYNWWYIPPKKRKWKKEVACCRDNAFGSPSVEFNLFYVFKDDTLSCITWVREAVSSRAFHLGTAVNQWQSPIHAFKQPGFVQNNPKQQKWIFDGVTVKKKVPEHTWTRPKTVSVKTYISAALSNR